MKSLSKATYGFIFAIVALVILLGVTLYLGLSGWFFSNVTKFESDIEVGKTINMSIDGTQSKIVSFTFLGTYLPGQKISQNINVTNDFDGEMYVRVKAVMFDYDEGEINLNLGVNEHWIKHDDYYYFDEKLPNANKISIASYIQMPQDVCFSSTKQYVSTIIVEGLDAKLDKQQIWGY